MLFVVLTVKMFEHFTKKNCKKQIKKSLELIKQSTEKVMNFILNGKVIKTCLIGA